MTNRDIIRLAPQTLIDTALGIDAEVMSSNPTAYKKANVINYDLAINTWLLICREYAPHTWTYLSTRILKTGLVATVNSFTDAAGCFLTNPEQLKTDHPLAAAILEEMRRRSYSPYVLATEYHSTESPEGVFLLICRYLKRFSPLEADLLEEKAVKDFQQNQKRLKQLMRIGYNQFIIDLCRAEVDTHLITKRVTEWKHILLGDIELTPGTCKTLDGNSLQTQAEKEKYLISLCGYNRIENQRRRVWDFEASFGNKAYLMTVPKTLKSSRTIAPEECLRQSCAHRMFTLRGDTIDLTDQSVNQRLAMIGSRDKTLSTLDLSHASDDVTWVLVQEIYQDFPDYLELLSKIRPTFINVKGKDLLLQSFATMGNSLTFLVETEVFNIISLAAIHFAERLGACSDTTLSIYGDDIVCSTDAYPFVQAFLEKLYFKVNQDKSYTGDSAFRESCGKDYYNGVDVSSPYFPRKPLKTLTSWWRNRNGELITVAESLISLQHRLFDVSAVAAQYIELYLREKQDDLGYEPAGTQTNDLWGYDLVVHTTRYIPEGRWTTEWPIVSGKFHWNGTEWTMREEHHRLVRHVVKDELHAVAMQKRPAVSVGQEARRSDIVYLEYLREGPYYQSDIDRLLGISTSRYEICTGRPVSGWRSFER